jgi:predicted dehydrogenase
MKGDRRPSSFLAALETEQVKMRVGVIGAGRIAHAAHLPVLASLPGVEIALCEPDHDRLELTAREFPIVWSTPELDTLLRAGGCDALFVLVPHLQMYEVSMRCLRSGLPTLLEKPPGMSGAAARQLALAANDSGTFNIVGFQRRFSPALTDGLKRLRQRTGIACMLIRQEMPSPRILAQNGVGDEVLRNVLPAHCIHYIDLLRMVLGEPDDIHVRKYRAFSDYDNCFDVSLAFRDGAIGHLHYSLLATNRSFEARILGDEQSLLLTGEGSEPEVSLVTGGSAEKLAVQPPDGVPPGPYIAGYYGQDSYFLNCVAAGRTLPGPAADIADALLTMQILDHIAGREPIGPSISRGAR